MKRNALLIGGFVVIAFAVIVIAIFWLSGSDIFGKHMKARIYYQGNVGGLSIGAPVTFRGVTVGQVTEVGIEVDSKTLKATAPVELKLQPASLRFSDSLPDTSLDVQTLVQRGLRARLVSQSIVTGQKGIELDFAPKTPATLLGRAGEPEIPALGDKFGPLIDQVADLPLRDTVDDVRNAVKELRTTLVSVQGALEGSQAVLVNASKEIQLTGVESRKTLASATDAIRLVQVSSAATLDSITRLANTSRDTVLAAQPELQRTLVGAREASESARLAMNRVADITAPGAPLRGDLESAVRDLSQAARGLRSLSELLEEKPNAVIFGNTRE
jgi:paraquat-inducible protein B